MTYTGADHQAGVDRQTSPEAVETTIDEERTIDTSTGEIISDTAVSDPLASPPRDLMRMEDLMPEKSSALALWSLTDDQMAIMSLEEFISSATIARSLNDFSNWIIGRLARGVQKQYGQDSLGTFARDIGIPKGTLQVYRWVAEVFKDQPDSDLVLMPFTAYITAAGTDQPMDWILQASEGEWSVEKLKYEIDVAKGKINPDDSSQEAKPKIATCDMCSKYRIINTDKICHCNANPGVDVHDGDFADALLK
jgi:hypothetical protein